MNEARLEVQSFLANHIDALDLSKKLDNCGKALTRWSKLEVDGLQTKIASHEKELNGFV